MRRSLILLAFAALLSLVLSAHAAPTLSASRLNPALPLIRSSSPVDLTLTLSVPTTKTTTFGVVCRLENNVPAAATLSAPTLTVASGATTASVKLTPSATLEAPTCLFFFKSGDDRFANQVASVRVPIVAPGLTLESEVEGAVSKLGVDSTTRMVLKIDKAVTVDSLFDLSCTGPDSLAYGLLLAATGSSGAPITSLTVPAGAASTSFVFQASVASSVRCEVSFVSGDERLRTSRVVLNLDVVPVSISRTSFARGCDPEGLVDLVSGEELAVEIKTNSPVEVLTTVRVECAPSMRPVRRLLSAEEVADDGIFSFNINMTVGSKSAWGVLVAPYASEVFACHFDVLPGGDPRFTSALLIDSIDPLRIDVLLASVASISGTPDMFVHTTSPFEVVLNTATRRPLDLTVRCVTVAGDKVMGATTLVSFTAGSDRAWYTFTATNLPKDFPAAGGEDVRCSVVYGEGDNRFAFASGETTVTIKPVSIWFGLDPALNPDEQIIIGEKYDLVFRTSPVGVTQRTQVNVVCSEGVQLSSVILFLNAGQDTVHLPFTAGSSLAMLHCSASIAASFEVGDVRFQQLAPATTSFSLSPVVLRLSVCDFSDLKAGQRVSFGMRSNVVVKGTLEAELACGFGPATPGMMDWTIFPTPVPFTFKDSSFYDSSNSRALTLLVPEQYNGTGQCVLRVLRSDDARFPLLPSTNLVWKVDVGGGVEQVIPRGEINNVHVNLPPLAMLGIGFYEEVEVASTRIVRVLASKNNEAYTLASGSITVQGHCMLDQPMGQPGSTTSGFPGSMPVCSAPTTPSAPSLPFDYSAVGGSLPLPTADASWFLGSCSAYAVHGSQAVTFASPASTLTTGSVGVSPGTGLTGHPDELQLSQGASADVNTERASQCATDKQGIYDYLHSLTCLPSNELTADLSGLTLSPGVWCAPSLELSAGSTLTLDARGDPNAQWVFQTSSTLITATATSFRLVNGAQECNVFWAVGSSATLASSSSFVGNIVALQSISLAPSAKLTGRAMALASATFAGSNLVQLPAPFSSNPPSCVPTSKGLVSVEFKLEAGHSSDELALTMPPELVTSQPAEVRCYFTGSTPGPVVYSVATGLTPAEDDDYFGGQHLQPLLFMLVPAKLKLASSIVPNSVLVAGTTGHNVRLYLKNQATKDVSAVLECTAHSGVGSFEQTLSVATGAMTSGDVELTRLTGRGAFTCALKADSVQPVAGAYKFARLPSTQVNFTVVSPTVTLNLTTGATLAINQPVAVSIQSDVAPISDVVMTVACGSDNVVFTLPAGAHTSSVAHYQPTSTGTKSCVFVSVSAESDAAFNPASVTPVSVLVFTPTLTLSGVGPSVQVDSQTTLTLTANKPIGADRLSYEMTCVGAAEFTSTHVFSFTRDATVAIASQKLVAPAVSTTLTCSFTYVDGDVRFASAKPAQFTIAVIGGAVPLSSSSSSSTGASSSSSSSTGADSSSSSASASSSSSSSGPDGQIGGGASSSTGPNGGNSFNGDLTNDDGSLSEGGKAAVAVGVIVGVGLVAAAAYVAVTTLCVSSAAAGGAGAAGVAGAAAAPAAGAVAAPIVGASIV